MAQRGSTPCGDPAGRCRRLVRSLGSTRYSLDLRGHAIHRCVARLGRRDCFRRHGGPDGNRSSHCRVLSRRVVRAVCPVPRRNGSTGRGASSVWPADDPSKSIDKERTLIDDSRAGHARTPRFAASAKRQRMRFNPRWHSARRFPKKRKSHDRPSFRRFANAWSSSRLTDERLRLPEGATLLDACRSQGIEIPTLCFLETLTPANACRLCVVELEGSRALVPACSRKVESGMVVHTNSERVRHSRKLVLEFLASSVDLSLAEEEVHRWMKEYDADPEDSVRPPHRFRRRAREPSLGTPHGARWRPGGDRCQPVKIHDELYVRDYAKCILCYKCVEACGEDAQNTFAIAVAGRGFDAQSPPSSMCRSTSRLASTAVTA